MSVITKQGVANFTSYNEEVNAQGELVITGIYNGTNLGQTVPANGIGILYFKPSNLNFYFITDLLDLDPEFLFVETILSVTP